MRKQKSWGRLLAEGAVVGVVATQALDWLSTFLYNRENRATWLAENIARGGMHAYERGLQKMVRPFGLTPGPGDIKRWGWRLHKAFGILGGVGYLALRRKVPALGWGRGLGMGLAFFLLGDEVMVPLLGLTPGPGSFDWRVHARGAASHIAYGIAAETAARALGN